MLASIFNGTDKQIRFRRCVQSQTRQKTIGHQVAKGRQHAILMSDSQRKTKRNERKEKEIWSIITEAFTGEKNMEIREAGLFGG